MKMIWALLILGLGLSACSDLTTVEELNEEGQVMERFTVRKEDSLRQGKYEAFDAEGRMVELAQYEAGMLEGERILYHPEGSKQYVSRHRKGDYHGPYKAYYPDGALQLEGEYVDNVATGIWTSYYPSGQKKEEVTLADNIETGPFREWHENGQLKAEGEYVGRDKEQGELKLYDEQGQLMRRMMCEAGICSTIWQAASQEQVTNEG